MTADSTKKRKPLVRYKNLDELPPAPPLRKAVKKMSDAEIERRAAADPDAGTIPPGFWDSAVPVEPEGTEQIQMRWVPFDETMAMIRRGEIRDAMTILAMQQLALERAESG